MLQIDMDAYMALVIFVSKYVRHATNRILRSLYTSAAVVVVRTCMYTQLKRSRLHASSSALLAGAYLIRPSSKMIVDYYFLNNLMMINVKHIYI